MGIETWVWLASALLGGGGFLGTLTLLIENRTGGSLSETLILNFTIIKGVTA